jgi:drug/metabolite transporter (DMT)-like permease
VSAHWDRLAQVGLIHDTSASGVSGRAASRPVAPHHLAALLVMGSIWGLQFAMLKLAAQGGYSELTALTVALSLIAVVFVAAMALRGAFFLPSRPMVFFLIFTALLGYVLPMAVVLFAAPHIPAGVMALVASFTPLVTVTLAFLLKSEAVSGRRLLAVGLSAVSVILLLLPELRLPDAGKLEWLLIAFLVPLMFGYESIYIDQHWPTGMDTFQVVTAQVVCAAAMVLPLYLLFGEPVSFDPAWPDAQTGVAVFALIGVVEVILYFYLIKQTGGVLVSFGSIISLFAGVFWGMIIFSETHGGAIWAAILMLAVAIALLGSESRRRALKGEEAGAD